MFYVGYNPNEHKVQYKNLECWVQPMNTLGTRTLESIEICFPFRFVYTCLNIHVYFLIVTIILIRYLGN